MTQRHTHNNGPSHAGLQPGELFHGFQVIQQYPIEEIDSQCTIFEHVQSGARLMVLQNDDDNKVFSATFRTPPADDMGIPHIVEHCVLSGSRKYHTKEPFMDLVKGSMSTFVNAMTFADKTMYPVASKTEADFFNLMDVYMDAVFFPKMRTDKSIFMQEGWRYDIQSEDEQPVYKGIVYNEMKGAYSDPERELENVTVKTLLEGTCYANESGGHPRAITDLTYEAFCAFHDTYYHPSNAYLYLYGDVDIERALAHMDSEFLCHFQARSVAIDYDTLPEGRGMQYAEGVYPASGEAVDDAARRDYMSFSCVVSKATDVQAALTTDLLKSILVNAPASPLRKALVEAELAEDIGSFPSDGLYQCFGVVLKHADGAQKETFERIVKETLTQICDEGLDRALILSTINRMTFRLKEAQGFHTKGIIYHMESMDSWLYSDEPSAFLSYAPILEALREAVDTDYYETFIRERILDAPHMVLCVLRPDETLDAAYANEDAAHLSAVQAALSPDALKALVEENRQLKTKQLSPDTPEAVATIPKLSPGDIPASKPHFAATCLQTDPYTLLHSDVFTGGIGYMDFIFDLGHMPEEDLPYVQLILQLLGDVDAGDLSYDTLSNTIYLYSGGIQFSASVMRHYHDPEKDALKVTARMKAMPEHFEKAFELLECVMRQSRFDGLKRIKERVSSIRTHFRSALVDSGNSFALGRVAAYLGRSGYLAERLMGISYYEFLGVLQGQLEGNPDEAGAVLDRMQSVYSRLFNAHRSCVSFTGEAEHCDLMKPLAEALIQTLPVYSEVNARDAADGMGVLDEGVKLPASVQFVAQGFDYKAAGFSYTGAMHVLTTFLNGVYLHNRVRAQGGAYGCGAQVSAAGFFGVASYRDPNLDETYAVYAGIAEDLKAMILEQDEVDTFIVGTMSRVDAARTPRQMGQMAYSDYLTGRTAADVQRVRTEILNTTAADIAAFVPLLEAFSAHSAYCTLGNGEAIDASSRFKTIKVLK